MTDRDPNPRTVRVVAKSAPWQTKRELAVELIAAPAIDKRIVVVRERQVVLDANLAEFYGVETGR